MKKTDLIRFRCTPEERKVIEDHARNDGLTLSEYLLKLVFEDQQKRIAAVTDEMERSAYNENITI